MYVPSSKSQSLQAPPSVDRSGRVDTERAVVHSASITLQSRTPGEFFGRLQLVLWLLCTQTLHTAQPLGDDVYSVIPLYTVHLLNI